MDISMATLDFCRVLFIYRQRSDDKMFRCVTSQSINYSERKRTRNSGISTAKWWAEITHRNGQISNALISLIVALSYITHHLRGSKLDSPTASTWVTSVIKIFIHFVMSSASNLQTSSKHHLHRTTAYNETLVLCTYPKHVPITWIRFND